MYHHHYKGSEIIKKFSQLKLRYLIGQKLPQNVHWPMKILRFETELRKNKFYNLRVRALENLLPS
jgi:hypothetical protein